MNVRREAQRLKPSAEGGPFRPMFVESQDMKIYYELDKDEVEEAVKEWLVNNHGIQLHDSRLIAFDKQGASGNRIQKSEKIGLFNMYLLAIEDEV